MFKKAGLYLTRHVTMPAQRTFKNTARCTVMAKDICLHTGGCNTLKTQPQN